MSVSEFSMQEQLKKDVFAYYLINVSYQSRYSVPLKAFSPPPKLVEAVVLRNPASGRQSFDE